jgi:hypothetical protein
VRLRVYIRASDPLHADDMLLVTINFATLISACVAQRGCPLLE